MVAKLEHVRATAGRYDFVAVLQFPDLEAGFRSRNDVYRLGVLTRNICRLSRSRKRSSSFSS
jgi:uncharacterized protein with GYD domain